MKFIGIDLHTNCFTVCFLDEKGNKSIITYNLNAEGTRRFLENVNMESYVIVEATINTFCFVNLIKSNVGQVLVANTYELKTISFTNKKTDKVDAYKLARIMKSQIMSGEEQVHPVVVAPEKIQDLRALFTTYRLERKQVVSTKNRIHSLLKQNLYPFTKEYIFGKFVSYLRSTPRVSSSNEKTIIKSTNKAGRKVSITLLSQGLNHFRNSNPKPGRWHDRLRVYKKAGIVRMGMCRRVITEIYQMLKKEEYHYFRDPENHKKKMNEYIKLLKKKEVDYPEEFDIAA